jgi:Spy/CpxP family protein refolding chaperone
MWQILAGAALVPLAMFVLTGGCADDPTLSSLLDTLTASLTTQTNQQTSTTDSTAESSNEDATETDAETDPNEAEASDEEPPFPGLPPWPGMGGRGPQLTEEQEAAIEDLEAALEAGQITQDEFCQQLHDLLGDPPCGPPLPPIDLTADQIAQAETIFQQAHDQIVSLSETARTDVLAQLTAEQQQALTDLEQQNAPPQDPNSPVGPLCPPPENAACAPPPQVPLPPCPSQDGPPWGPPQGGIPHGFEQAGMLHEPHMGPGPRGPHPLCLSEDTIAALSLSADQVTAIEGIHDTLRTAVQQAQDDAQQAFQALLTEEQLAQLDQLPPPPPWAPGPPPGHWHE